MPFKFVYIADLLDSLEKIQVRDPPFLPTKRDQAIRLAVQAWFHRHRREIDSDDYCDAGTGRSRSSKGKRVAILSCFFPRRRPDRVFNIQATRLTKIVGRCLKLNSKKLAELQGWKDARNHGGGVGDAGDLGACVERVLKESDVEPKPGVATVEEVDAVLDELAARCRFSSPQIRGRGGRDREQQQQQQQQQHLGAAVPEEILRPLYLKLRSSEAKWLTRMVLKDFGPVVLNDNHGSDDDDISGRLVMRHVHFLLPSLLKFQADLRAVVELLNGPLKCYPSRTDPQSEKLHFASAAAFLAPNVGLKVGNPSFDKARSIKHCVRMAGKNRWTVERKYDGEYCEIHIDLTKQDSSSQIKIFSKSGKDSTDDRKEVHETVRNCLMLGHSDCPIREKCILLAEMVAYSDKDQSIIEFHKIRKLVTRSGRRLGTANDSQRHEYEHLMLVFFDLLLIDDDFLMLKAQEERRQRLAEVVTTIKGRGIIAEASIINFCDSINAPKILQEQFVASIRACHEGLVLKPCRTPYVNFGEFVASMNDGSHGIFERRNRFVKLKKDFIPGLGDTADLVVIGGSYNAQKSFRHRVPGMEFTSFYLACPERKHCHENPTLNAHDGSIIDDGSNDKRPSFKIVGVIDESVCIPRPCITVLNDMARFMAVSYDHHHNHRSDIAQQKEPSLPFSLSFTASDLARSMQKVFKEPIVCEVLGSGFEKPSGSNTYMLRHPRMLKVHTDRTWKDAVTFEGLQGLAEESLRGVGGENIEVDDEEMEEMRRLVGRSMVTERSVDSQCTTVATATTCCEGINGSLDLHVTQESFVIEGDARQSMHPPTERDDEAEDLKNGNCNYMPVDVSVREKEESQAYYSASSTRHKTQEHSLPTPPASSFSSVGSSRNPGGKRRISSDTQSIQDFQTAPPALALKTVPIVFTVQQQHLGSSAEDDRLATSFKTPLTTIGGQTKLSYNQSEDTAQNLSLSPEKHTGNHMTRMVTATTMTESNEKQKNIPTKRKEPPAYHSDLLYSQKVSETSHHRQPHLSLDYRRCGGDVKRARKCSQGMKGANSTSQDPPRKEDVGSTFIPEKAYSSFAKVLSRVSDVIEKSSFGFGDVASHQRHQQRHEHRARHDRHRHHQPRGEEVMVYEDNGQDGIKGNERRKRGSLTGSSVSRNAVDENTIIGATQISSKYPKYRTHHKSPHDTASPTKRVKHRHHHHHHHRRRHRNNSANPQSQNQTVPCKRSHTCTCPQSPTLTLQSTTIHLSTTTLTVNRRAQLKMLLARKHGSAVVVRDLGYWARNGKEDETEENESTGNGSDSCSDHDAKDADGSETDDQEQADDEVVLESQSYPELTKIVFVDALGHGTAKTSSPPISTSASSSSTPVRPAQSDRLIRLVIQELDHAHVRNETVYVWDWRILRSLTPVDSNIAKSGGSDGGGCGAAAYDTKPDLENADRKLNNNNKKNNSPSNAATASYFIGKLTWQRKRARNRSAQDHSRNHDHGHDFSQSINNNNNVANSTTSTTHTHFKSSLNINTNTNTNTNLVAVAAAAAAAGNVPIKHETTQTRRQRVKSRFVFQRHVCRA